ncbi:MAG: hypothetical protein HC905_22620 [Bacteroidales bacterium]|nr:hypothetical protein [Bacteroidales bacterium]
MTSAELKNQLIEKINKLSDETLLQDVMKLIDNTEESEIFILSDDHEAAVNIAIDQISKGDFLTNNQANKEINEWLNK